MGTSLVSVNTYTLNEYNIIFSTYSVWLEHIGPKKDIYSLAYNPQFSLKVNVPDKKPAAVWLLLSKHIMMTEENTDYITLHVYDDTGGERIYYPDNPFKEVRSCIIK